MSRNNIIQESSEPGPRGHNNSSTSGKERHVKPKEPIHESLLRFTADEASDRFGRDFSTIYYSSPQQIADSPLDELQSVRDIPEWDLYGSHVEASSSGSGVAAPSNWNSFLADYNQHGNSHEIGTHKRHSMFAGVKPWDPPNFDNQVPPNRRPWEESTHSSFTMTTSDQSRGQKPPRKRTEAKKEYDRRKMTNLIERKKNEAAAAAAAAASAIGPPDPNPNLSITLTPASPSDPNPNPTSLIDLVRSSSPEPRPFVKSETWNHDPPALQIEQWRKRNGYRDDQGIQYYSQTGREEFRAPKSRTMPVPLPVWSEGGERLRVEEVGVEYGKLRRDVPRLKSETVHLSRPR